MAIFMPNVTSVAAVAIVFGTLFQRDFGVVNWVLSLVGIDADRLDGTRAVELLDRHRRRWWTGAGPATTP